MPNFKHESPIGTVLEQVENRQVNPCSGATKNIHLGLRTAGQSLIVPPTGSPQSDQIVVIKKGARAPWPGGGPRRPPALKLCTVGSRAGPLRQAKNRA